MEAPHDTSVLIVEDEVLIALDIESTLHELGCAETVLAADVERATAVASRAPLCAALVDLNLGGMSSFAVASVLGSRKIPFAFLTGYDQAVVPDAFAAVPVLRKPFTRGELLRVLQLLELA